MKKGVVELYELLMEDNVLVKYILKRTWLSGCSTHVSPISINHERRRIEFQLERKANEYLLRGVLKKIADFGAKTAYISKHDGSCPKVLVIYVN